MEDAPSPLPLPAAEGLCARSLPAVGREGASSRAADGSSPLAAQGPCSASPVIYTRAELMFPFKLTKAENGAREGL